MVENSEVGFVEGGRGGFGVGDRLGGRCGRRDVVGWVEGVDGVDGCCDWEDGWEGVVEDWVLLGECGFYASLPEAGEEHEEEPELNQ